MTAKLTPQTTNNIFFLPLYAQKWLRALIFNGVMVCLVSEERVSGLGTRHQVVRRRIHLLDAAVGPRLPRTFLLQVLNKDVR